MSTAEYMQESLTVLIQVCEFEGRENCLPGTLNDIRKEL